MGDVSNSEFGQYSAVDDFVVVPKQFVNDVSRVLELINNARGQNGINIDTTGDAMVISGRRGSGQDFSKYSFSWLLTQPTVSTDAKVTLRKGYVEHHGYDPITSTAKTLYTPSTEVERDIDTTGYYVFVIRYTLSTNVVSVPLPLFHATDAEMALDLAVDTSAALLKPIITVHLDLGTSPGVLTLEHVHNAPGNNIFLPPVFIPT